MNFRSDNPSNLWQGRKIFIIFVGLVLVVNSTLNSSLPSGAADYIAAEFNISNQQRKTLLVSIFLIGYIFGPIVFAPLSEVYGRKWVMLIPFVFFTGFSIGCALSSNWAMLLVFRFIVGATAAASITVVNGIVADIYTSPLYRGRAIALKMVVSYSNINMYRASQ